MKFLKEQEDIKVTEKDTLGGGSFVWNTGVYDVIVDGAYIDVSKGGAYSINLALKDVETGKVLNITEYVTNGAEKGCLNYFVNKKGEKQYLPGYEKMRTLSLILTGETLDKQELEDKLVEVYDPELGKRAPRKKQVIMSWLGKRFKAGIIKGIEPKYNKPDETREFNELAKIFDEEGRTITEKEAGTEPEFINKWKEKYNSEFIKDKTKGKSNTSTGSKDKPKKSLFS